MHEQKVTYYLTVHIIQEKIKTYQYQAFIFYTKKNIKTLMKSILTQEKLDSL